MAIQKINLVKRHYGAQYKPRKANSKKNDAWFVGNRIKVKRRKEEE